MQVLVPQRCVSDVLMKDDDFGRTVPRLEANRHALQAGGASRHLPGVNEEPRRLHRLVLADQRNDASIREGVVDAVSTTDAQVDLCADATDAPRRLAAGPL